MSPFLRRHLNRTVPSILMSLILTVVAGCSHGSSSSSPAPSPEAQASTVTAPAPGSPAPQSAAPAAAAAPGPAPGGATAEQLEELVSPIALYPDRLVAQILAASTYPTQVVEAYRWLDQNSNLKGDQLAAAVNQQAWDPSVKSLCQYPPVLKTMSDSLSWTSSLGQAYYNQPTDVLNAIQVMRKRAMDAGTLKSTPQQTVEVQSTPPASGTSGGQSAVSAPAQTIIVNPAQPNTVYVPEYNPSSVYGAPVQSPPGYTGGELLATGLVSFGAGMLIGSLISSNDNDWGCNWGAGNVTYNRNVYVSNSGAVPGRWNGGYRPGYRGPVYAGGVRPPYPSGRYARPAPYTGYHPNFNSDIPNTRPYHPSNTRQFAGGSEPHFPSLGHLPGGRNTFNRPNQIGRENAFNNPGARRLQNPGSRIAFNKPTNLRNDQMRGYGQARGGGRNNAFGGHGPARQTQAFSDRGRASFRGGGGGFHSQGGRNFGGGGGRRRR
jgi:hypothetical protein